MKQSSRHSKRRGGIFDSSYMKHRTTKRKAGIMSLVVAKMAGADVPIGMMRSKSVTRIFRQRRAKA